MRLPDAASSGVLGIGVSVLRSIGPRERRRFPVLVALLALAGLLEMVGIAALLPVLQVFQDPGVITGSPVIARAHRAMGAPPRDTFILLCLMLLLAYYVAKNVFLVAVDRFQFHMLAGLQTRWSQALMRAYLGRPLAFHVQTNSAQLIRNVTTEVNTVLYYVLVPVATLLAEACVLAPLLLLLLLVDVRAAVLFLLLGGAFLGLFHRAYRLQSFRIGQVLQASSAQMIQQSKEAFGAIKEIKVGGSEAHFGTLFGKNSDAYSAAWERSLVLYKLPMRVIETVFVAIFAGLLALLTWSDKAGTAFPLLAVYAAAAFRVIPSLNRIVTSLNHLKQGQASMQVLADELSQAREAVPRHPASRLEIREIRVDGLRYRHASAAQDSLNDISLRIAGGEVLCFAGPSGSGKTTLADCIIGLLEPSAGRITVNGRDISELGGAWQGNIGYIPQHIYLVDDTLERNVAFGLPSEAIDRNAVDRALQAAQLSELVRSLPEGTQTVIGEHGARLSGGQRQRIGIARALYRDPALLVMDEATSALDEGTESAIVSTVLGLHGRTIIVIAHRQATIDACDRVVWLEGGQLFETPGRAKRPS